MTLQEWCEQNNRLDLLSQWNFALNVGVSPQSITCGSHKKVWWKCDAGHEWESIIPARIRGNNCPYCAGQRVIPGVNDLATLNPQLAVEWNYEKNYGLKNGLGYDISIPSLIMLNSNNKVWWKCDKGHEWQATVNSRTDGNGCPYCSNKKVLSGFNDLVTLRPDLAKEWNYEKNDNIVPSLVIVGSNKKVWWKCSHGHEWLASVSHRCRGKGCPYCSGRFAIKNENDLMTVNPDLAEEWNYDKNDGLTPYDVKSGSSKIVWWKCKYGHEWRSRVNHRVNGIGCPYCSGAGSSLPEQGIAFYLEQVCSVEQRIKVNGQEIDVYLPDYDIGIEYDGMYYHNEDTISKELKKDFVLQNYGVRLIRIKESDENKICDSTIYYSFDNMGSHYDWAILALCKLLNKFTDTNLFSSIRIDSKENLIKIRSRFDMYRKSNSLAMLYPDIANDWNYDKNNELTPDMFSANSAMQVWWKCKNGHEWQSAISTRTSMHCGCPYCSNQKVLAGYNDLETLYPDIAKDWNYDKNDFMSPHDFVPGSGKKVWWKCSICGYEWKSIIYTRTKMNCGCPRCGRNKIGKALAKRVKCIETGQIYESVSFVQRTLGIHHVGDCCNGKRPIAGGYHWKYVDEDK